MWLSIRRLLLDPNGSPEGVASVSVAITQSPDGQYVLLLDLIDREGASHQRRIAGETCAAVIDAAAVAIALAGDTDSGPKALEATTPQSIQPAPSVVAPKSTPISTPGAASRKPTPLLASPSDSTSPHRTSRHSWDLEGFGGADFASLPSPTPGFGLAVTKDIAKNQISLGASAWIPERAALTSRTTSGAHIGLYVASLRYGRSLFSGRFDLVPSAGIEAGALVAKGTGVQNPKVGVGPWVAPFLGLTGFVQITPGFALSLEVEGLVVAARPRFDITLGGQVYEPPPATARSIFGLHAQFL